MIGETTAGQQTKAKKRRNNNKVIKGKGIDSYEMYSKNYKTQPCEYHRKGICTKGDECTYSHDFEVKQLEKICKFFLSGGCHKSNCLYLHDSSKYPCKFYYISGKCDKLSNCTFSHEAFKAKEQMLEYLKDNLEAIRKHHKSGIVTPLIAYAVDHNYLVNEAEEQRKVIDSLKLIPAELDYDDDSDYRAGGQIDDGGSQDSKSKEGEGKGRKKQALKVETEYFPF